LFGKVGRKLNSEFCLGVLYNFKEVDQFERRKGLSEQLLNACFETLLELWGCFLFSANLVGSRLDVLEFKQIKDFLNLVLDYAWIQL
jgi:hypothetical protein